jgi:putative peptidoglycan lipid II flippase
VARLPFPHARGVASPSALAQAVSAFAPGLIGYGLVAHLGRTLYACGRGRQAAVATVAGWIAVLAADLVLSAILSHGSRLDALAWGNTVGMTVAGVALLWALPASAREGLSPMVMATGGAGSVSAAIGFVLADHISTNSLPLTLVGLVGVGALVLAVYLVIVTITMPALVQSTLGRRTP